MYSKLDAPPLSLTGGVYSKCYVPLPHVFPPPPFPLEREPTASAPRGDTLSTHIDKYRSLVMSLRFVRRLRNRMAQSLVLSVKFGVRFSRRLAARVPNRHIPLISALQSGQAVYRNILFRADIEMKNKEAVFGRQP